MIPHDRLPPATGQHQPWCDSPLCGGCMTPAPPSKPKPSEKGSTVDDAGRVMCAKDTYLVISVGDGAQMTCPRGPLEWQMRYGNPEQHRFTAASALESYYYLVAECTKDEAWRRIKLMRTAMKANPPKDE